jgi:hypothetical protein
MLENLAGEGRIRDTQAAKVTDDAGQPRHPKFPIRITNGRQLGVRVARHADAVYGRSSFLERLGNHKRISAPGSDQTDGSGISYSHGSSV